MSRTPEEYAAYLSKRRNALAHFQHTEEAIERAIDSEATDARRRLIIAALHSTKWDPADGRWTKVHHLCRLDITRGGYRWLGTRVERRGERSIAGMNSSRPAEKQQKKRNDESRRKVESWKQTMAREMANNETRVADSPGTQASLSFKVAKRTAFTNIVKSSSHRPDPDPQKPQATNVSSQSVCLLHLKVLSTLTILSRFYPCHSHLIW